MAEADPEGGRLRRALIDFGRGLWTVGSVGIVAALLGTILGYVLPIEVARTNAPPPVSTVTDLMDKEVEAGKQPNTRHVDQIYASGAAVTDAACRTPSASQSWYGYGPIEGRYQNLPKFEALYHVNVHVSYEPDNSDAARAEATSDTIGIMIPAGTSVPQTISGHEQWIFVKSGGRWVIQAFIYNLCQP